MQAKRKNKVFIAFMLCLSLLSFAAAILTGSSDISIIDAISVLTGENRGLNFTVIAGIRLPRAILAFFTGASLSLAGTLLQGLFRNPLVEPYTIGISGGASLAVSAGLALKLQAAGGAVLPALGFAGALASIAIIYYLGFKNGKAKIQGLLLTGVMISFITSSAVMLIMAVSKADDIHGIVFWIMGSLDEQNKYLIAVSVICSIASLTAALLLSNRLNALMLGEDEAAHLGINVERTKKILFVIASLITGISVSVCGVIGFVGLVVPHIIRLFTGPDHRLLIPGAFLGGAVFLILSDTAARTIIAPVEIPVGVITGIIGGTVFVYFLSGREKTL